MLTQVYLQGTNSSSLSSILHDADFIWTSPDDDLHLPSGALVDQGFQTSWKSTWTTVLNFVAGAQAHYPGSDLTITGHSLGAAAATLATLGFGDRVTRAITFGQPRVGNKIVADAVDQRFGPQKVSYVANGRDWVVHVVPRILGAQHFSGQIWINPANSSNWKYYPGQENIYGADSVLDPPLNFYDHRGIYFRTQVSFSRTI